MNNGHVRKPNGKSFFLLWRPKGLRSVTLMKAQRRLIYKSKTPLPTFSRPPSPAPCARTRKLNQVHVVRWPWWCTVLQITLKLSPWATATARLGDQRGRHALGGGEGGFDLRGFWNKCCVAMTTALPVLSRLYCRNYSANGRVGLLKCKTLK